jgi:WD40 repeat protein
MKRLNVGFVGAIRKRSKHNLFFLGLCLWFCSDCTGLLFYWYAAANEAARSSIHFEKELNIKSSGLSAFTWSPDSQFIAFTNRMTGVAGVVNVASGRVNLFSGKPVQGLQAIAWSSDGRLVAIENASQVRLISVFDNAIIHEYDLGAQLYLGDDIIFSSDGASILINNIATTFQTPLIYRLNIKDGNVETAIAVPYTMRRVSIRSASFRAVGGQIYLSALMTLGDEDIIKDPLPNGSFLEIHLQNPVCHIYSLSGNGNMLSHRSLYLKAYDSEGVETRAQRRFTFGCHYSVPTGTVIVGRTSLNQITGSEHDANENQIFGVFDLTTGKLKAQFGDASIPENGNFAFFDLHPSLPWAVTSSNFVGLWKLPEGELIARENIPGGNRPPNSLREPRFSPDGMRVAFRRSNGTIQIYKITESENNTLKNQ